MGRRSTGGPSPRMAQPKRQRRRGVVDGVRVADEADAGPTVCGAPQAFGVPRERVPLRELDVVPAYDAFCSAPVRCGKSACPGACQRARVLLLITSMPRVWIVVFCVEEGFLGAP